MVSVPHDFDAAALIMSPADVPLALQVREVLVHRRQRAEREPLGNLLKARGVPLRGDLARNEVQDFALAARERHDASRMETEA